MSLADRMLAAPIERDMWCEKCNKKYIQRLEDQAIGFRVKSEDKCPYCGYVRITSMGYDYINRKE